MTVSLKIWSRKVSSFYPRLQLSFTLKKHFLLSVLLLKSASLLNGTKAKMDGAEGGGRERVS